MLYAGTWTVQGSGEFTGQCFYALAVHPTDPNTVFAATDVAIDPSTPGTVSAAFWGSGVYRTTNAAAGNPHFSQVSGLPSSLSRISLAIAPSSPSTVYAAGRRRAALAGARRHLRVPDPGTPQPINPSS
jgi:hypothetical protein